MIPMLSLKKLMVLKQGGIRQKPNGHLLFGNLAQQLSSRSLYGGGGVDIAREYQIFPYLTDSYPVLSENIGALIAHLTVPSTKTRRCHGLHLAISSHTRSNAAAFHQSGGGMHTRPGMEETLRLELVLDQKMSVWKPSVDLWMASSHEDSKIL